MRQLPCSHHKTLLIFCWIRKYEQDKSNQSDFNPTLALLPSVRPFWSMYSSTDRINKAGNEGIIFEQQKARNTPKKMMEAALTAIMRRTSHESFRVIVCLLL